MLKKFLRKPLAIGSVFLIVIFTILTITFTYSTNFIENKQTDILLTKREVSQREIGHYFHVTETMLLDLADYFNNITSDDADTLDYLISVERRNPFVYSIYLGKADKTMINSSGFVPGDDFDLTERPWYTMAINNPGEVVHTPAFVNATEDRIIVTLAKAVYHDDALIGVIAADIDIQYITQIISETDIGETGYAFLIDQNNRLIAHPSLAPETVSLDETLLLSLNGDEGFEKSFELDDKKGALAYTTIADGDYTLGLFMPSNEFSGTIDLYRNVMVVVLAVLTFMSVMLFSVYQTHVYHPIHDLIDEIMAIDIPKNINYRLPESQTKGFPEVRHAINKVLDSTTKSIALSKETQHQLLLENQRVKLLMDSTADIIFEIDKDKHFTRVYGNGLKKIGMTPDDFIGKTILDVFGHDGENRDEVYDRALSGEQVFYDWTYDKNGGTLYFEASISPIHDETGEIIGAVGVTRDITEPMERQKKIEYISTHDFLTGLHNRRYFVEIFVDFCRKIQKQIGLLMSDLNGLKILNDAYGHDVGDEALIAVADTLRRLSPDDSIIARIGGDEFTVILPVSKEETIIRLKEKIKRSIAREKIRNIPLSIAIGHTVADPDECNLEDLIKEAENHMYRNKIAESKSIRNNTIQAIYETLTDKFKVEKIHSKRVAELSVELGKALDVHGDDLKELRLAAMYHDIGKISIPDAILDKPAPLTENEFEVIKAHSENGYNILRAADRYSNLAEHALCHHERWDGTGYPQGLKGTEIPLFSRIIALADAYETMTASRPYKKPISKEAALQEIERCTGTQFDPDIAAKFIEIIKE